MSWERTSEKCRFPISHLKWFIFFSVLWTGQPFLQWAHLLIKTEGRGERWHVCLSQMLLFREHESVFPRVTDFLEDRDYMFSHLSHSNVSLLCWQSSESQHAVWFWVSGVSCTSLHHSDPPSPLSDCTWFYFPVLQIMNLACLIWHTVPTTVNGRPAVPLISAVSLVEVLKKTEKRKC